MPLDPSEPFSRKAALESGLRAGQFRGRRFSRLHRGVYVRSDTTLSLVARCRAALLALPRGAVFSRFTAAELWGGVVPPRSRLTVTVPFRASARQPLLEVARARSMPPRRQRKGLPVTTPERTFLDLAAVLDLVDLVVLGDSLVRSGVTTTEALVIEARQFRGTRTALARRAAALVRAGVDSPMETRVRLLIVLAGLREPVVNHILRGDTGAWAYRLDLSYPDLRIAIEYDGRQHAESSKQWVRDVARREDFDTLGWRMLVLLSGDVFQTPGATLERICALLHQRGQAATVTSNEWRAHFPGR
jgi:hypothetical protein